MKKVYLLFVAFTIILIIDACKKAEVPEGALNDDSMYQLITSQNFTFYKNNSDRLPAVSASAHGGYIRTSFNNIAQNALDSNGVLPSTEEFPDSSIVLKEIYDGQTDGLNLYAVMMKLPDHPNQSGGWIWSEYDPNGGTIISIAEEGKACVSCHSAVDNRDLIRTFAFH
jgi:hypothetical protein